jgi:hypothetical protein
VTTADAHAWVEAYFPGLGWIPFDATPLAGITGGTGADLAWAPHTSTPNSASNDVPGRPTGQAHPSPSAGARNANGTQLPGAARTELAWVGWTALGVALVVAIGAAPAMARWQRRRARLRTARGGDPGSLWIELSATAHDLGYVWSPARTPRQVVGWLAPDLGPESSAALGTLAAAVEHARYAARPRSVVGADDLIVELQVVEAQLRGRRSRRTRIRSRLWPASLGWLTGKPRRRRGR